LVVEIFQIVRSERMAAGDHIAETCTNYIVHSLPVPLPQKKKTMKGRKECEILGKVLPAFLVQLLKRTGD
jgi:hypothetical protein